MHEKGSDVLRKSQSWLRSSLTLVALSGSLPLSKGSRNKRRYWFATARLILYTWFTWQWFMTQALHPAAPRRLNSCCWNANLGNNWQREKGQKCGWCNCYMFANMINMMVFSFLHDMNPHTGPTAREPKRRWTPTYLGLPVSKHCLTHSCPNAILGQLTK